MSLKYKYTILIKLFIFSKESKRIFIQIIFNKVNNWKYIIIYRWIINNKLKSNKHNFTNK